MSAQRIPRWSNIVQMLYKCFVFAGEWYVVQCSINYSPQCDHCFYVVFSKWIRDKEDVWTTHEMNGGSGDTCAHIG